MRARDLVEALFFNKALTSAHDFPLSAFSISLRMASGRAGLFLFQLHPGRDWVSIHELTGS